MEIIVVLNDAATCTIPVGTFFFSFLRKTFFLPPVALGISLNRDQLFLFLARGLLLGNRRLAWTLSSTRVGVRSLTTHRQCTTVSQTAIAADVHQALDIHLD